MIGFVVGSSFSTRRVAGARCNVSSRRQAQAEAAVDTEKATQFENLQKLTVIVEDTGDFDTIRKHKPVDATTNPSLIYTAASMDRYNALVATAIKYAQKSASTKESQLVVARDKLSTLFGAEITKIVPGYVSTEVDARLSFDTEASVEKAHELLRMYEEVGVGKDRILIKLASTWEGLKACEILEKDGISCNMTLIFSLAQAAVAADVGATLVSPFVGRILDWNKKEYGVESYAPEEDPGVISVKNIFNYYKCHDYKTIVMGASFRNLDEILQLAGCDRLTIAPKFIEQMKNSYDEVVPHLQMPAANLCDLETKLATDEASFRWYMNEDKMATDKLSEGIRGFAKDSRSLDEKLLAML
ncbi:hypothetical protein NDN08_003091 [Rhodosorus marinus]|uniref:Transaldolase n=1 Tax=Rhodosorus marinus TaxID=101924 RepID=A0AAV8UY89_9RHOD|nr:hypothetical protein NDN08_003091 [Rhodosorus marinus]